MAAPQGPTSLTKTGLVDATNADAADVLVPFNETETAIDEARTTLIVSDNDTTKKYLEDALTAGSGIAISTLNEGANEQVQITSTVEAAPVGAMLLWPTNTAPSKWLLCDGSLISMTTYKSLLDVYLVDIDVENDLGLDTGTAFTADNATNLFTSAGHGLSNNDVVMVSNSGGALPAGLNSNTAYYVINATTNDFQLSTTQGGSAVDITDDGTGTHYFHTQFKNLDWRGRFPLGQDDMGGTSANRVTDTEADKLAGSGGEETHTLTESEIPAHNHQITNYSNSPVYTSTGGGSNLRLSGGVADSSSTTPNTTVNTGGDGAHNNMPPYLTINFIVYAGV